MFLLNCTLSLILSNIKLKIKSTIFDIIPRSQQPLAQMKPSHLSKSIIINIVTKLFTYYTRSNKWNIYEKLISMRACIVGGSRNYVATQELSSKKCNPHLTSSVHMWVSLFLEQVAFSRIKFKPWFNFQVTNIY